MYCVIITNHKTKNGVQNKKIYFFLECYFGGGMELIYNSNEQSFVYNS